jgi:hypothetical protein
MELDPRFDAVRGTREFRELISTIAARVSQMRMAAWSHQNQQPSNESAASVFVDEASNIVRGNLPRTTGW